MKKIIVGAALLLAAIGAQAQDTGIYVGGHVGQSKAESTCDGVSGTGITCDDTSTAWRVLVGYQLHPNVAVELGYVDLGEVKATGPGGRITASATAFDLSAIGSVNVWKGLSPYVRLGVYRAKVEQDINTVTFVDSSSETNTGVVYGLGLRYDVTRRLAVRAEWQKYNEVGGSTVGEDDITVISLGVLFKF